MKNDKKILALVKDLKNQTILFIKTVELYDSQCAQADRKLERLLKTAGEIKKLYDTQAPESDEKPVAYKHIKDCWRALEKCQSIEEVEERFKEFPRWSGEWYWFYDNGSFCVRNDYSDEETEDYEVRELEQLSCEGDEVHWEIIFKEWGEEEKVLHYNDADDARADFKYFTEEEPEYYERVALREVIYPEDGEEDEIRDLENWTPDRNKKEVK